MRAFTVREVLKAVGGRYFGSESALDAHVTCVSSDSRDIGDGALFVAFKGARVDGHSYMADCLKRGAVCCISEREPEDAAEMPLIRVSSSLAAIGALAGWYRRGEIEPPKDHVSLTNTMIQAFLDDKMPL